MEQEFLGTLALDQVRVVPVARLDSDEARRFCIRTTPTLLRMADGKEAGRCEGAKEIAAALQPPAASQARLLCRRHPVARLRWIEEGDHRAGWVYRRFGGTHGSVPDIYKAMSLRPELMEKVLDLTEREHFSDGFLDCRTKERLATLVSSLNHSRYCTGSHAAGLARLGARRPEIAALVKADVSGTALPPKQRALLEFARRLTTAPQGDVAGQVQQLRDLGWRDEQIFEAAFDVSLFNFFNRMAATYDLEAPPDGWQPHTVPAAPQAVASR